jgi:hypothetical protein
VVNTLLISIPSYSDLSRVAAVVVAFPLAASRISVSPTQICSRMNPSGYGRTMLMMGVLSWSRMMS